MYKLRKLHNENFILFPSNDPFFALLLALSPCQSTQTTILNITDMVDNGFESSILGLSMDTSLLLLLMLTIIIQNMPLIYDFCLNTIWDTQTHNLKCLCEASSYILFFCKGRHASLLNHFQIEHNLHNFITKNAFIKLKWLHSIINNEDGLWASILHYIWLNISLWKINSFNNGVGIGKNNSITNISIKEKNHILNKISKPSNTKVWYTDDKQHMRNPKRY